MGLLQEGVRIPASGDSQAASAFPPAGVSVTARRK